MSIKKVDSLYGLKLGDNVQYIGNSEVHYNKTYFNTKGKVVEIVPATGEFRVSAEDLPFQISFQRTDLLLLDAPERYKVDFEGMLTETKSLSLDEMVSYLTKYHNFKEGKNFSVSDRDEVKEVMLTNKSYATLIKDIMDTQKVSREMDIGNITDFKHTMKPTISNAISLSFKTSDWTFRTHLHPWTLQHNLLSMYGVNINDEWGFNNVEGDE